MHGIIRMSWCERAGRTWTVHAPLLRNWNSEVIFTSLCCCSRANFTYNLLDPGTFFPRSIRTVGRLVWQSFAKPGLVHRKKKGSTVKLSERKRLLRENYLAGRRGLKVLREIDRWLRYGQLPSEELRVEAIQAAMEMSRCSFDFEDDELDDMTEWVESVEKSRSTK